VKRYRRVGVRWLDAVECAGEWIEHGKGTNKPMPSRTCGFLVANDAHAVTIAALVNRNHYSLAVTIPRRMVTSIRYLDRSHR